MNCQYSDIVNLETDPELPPQWSYSKSCCEFSELELIQNASTGAEFYLDKKVSYGDVLILVFLMIFLIFGILKFLTDFLIPKLINFKRK